MNYDEAKAALQAAQAALDAAFAKHKKALDDFSAAVTDDHKFVFDTRAEAERQIADLDRAGHNRQDGIELYPLARHHDGKVELWYRDRYGTLPDAPALRDCVNELGKLRL